ncbi:hypothetical protein MKZ23_05105 [Paenibacillus sp. FSL R5-0876]|nr:hypothetical protein BJP50_29645 [Paenibacillus odorifer]
MMIPKAIFVKFCNHFKIKSFFRNHTPLRLGNEMVKKEADSKYTSDNNDFSTLDDVKKMIGVENILEEKQKNKHPPITVAVLDSGIYPHQDLTSPDNRIVAFKDMVNGLEEPYTNKTL